MIFACPKNWAMGRVIANEPASSFSVPVVGLYPVESRFVDPMLTALDSLL